MAYGAHQVDLLDEIETPSLDEFARSSRDGGAEVNPLRESSLERVPRNQG